MILGIYTVRDRAVGAFLTPFFARSDNEALRSFRDACSDPNHQFNKHLTDFSLFRSGTFDDSNGVVEALPVPDRIITGEAIASEVPFG